MNISEMLGKMDKEGIRLKVESKEIHEVLLNIGIPASILGYSYIIAAEECIFMNPEYLRSITKRLYVDVARLCGTTAQRVERAIRHAISVGWSVGDVDYIDRVFHNSVNPLRGVPTNSQFLSCVYYYLRYEWE